MGESDLFVDFVDYFAKCSAGHNKVYEQITVPLAGVLHPSLPIMAAKGRSSRLREW